MNFFPLHCRLYQAPKPAPGRQTKLSTPRSTAKAGKGDLGAGGGTEAAGWLRGSAEMQDVWWLTVVGKECHLPPPHQASHSSRSLMTQRRKGSDSKRHLHRKGPLEKPGCIQQRHVVPAQSSCALRCSQLSGSIHQLTAMECITEYIPCITMLQYFWVLHLSLYTHIPFILHIPYQFVWYGNKYGWSLSVSSI